MLKSVLAQYEVEGQVERYDTSAAKAKPPAVSHAFKLMEDANYCVERACNLIRGHGLTLKAAHAWIVEEVQGEYPEKSPRLLQYENLKDAFRKRGIRVSDLKGENGGNGGPSLSS